MAAAEPGKRKDFKREFLTCSICANPFDGEIRVPKCLPCLHCFCLSCLRTYAASKSFVNCPICRKKCSVPENGADGFVTNFNVGNLQEYQHLHQPDRVSVSSKDDNGQTLCTNCDSGDPAVGFCYDCEAELCESCIGAHKTWRALKPHETVTIEEFRTRDRNKPNRQRPHERCRAHGKNNLSAFCNTCHIPICDTCGITDHREHEILNLDKAIQEAIKTLQYLATAVRAKIDPLERLSGAIDTRINDISAVFTEREKDIDAQFELLTMKLNERREQSKEELQDRCQVLTKLLREQRNDVEALTAQYDSACDFAEQTCEYANPVQLFKHQGMVTQQLNDLISETLPHSEPIAHSYMVFTDGHAEIIKWLDEEALRRIGETRTSDTLASKCCSETEINVVVPMESPQNVVIRAVRYDEKPQCIGGDPFIATLQLPDGSTVQCDIVDNNDGTYKIPYTTQTHGVHHLDVSLFGKPIQNSPFRIQVRRDSICQSNDAIDVDIPVALVGYPHDIIVNLSTEKPLREDGKEAEARLDRVQASIVTQTGDSVKCTIDSNAHGRYQIRSKPPVDGMLSLHLTVNGIPAVNNPYNIPVMSASPKATTVSLGQPIINQVWSIHVSPHDCRQTPITVPDDAVKLKVVNLVSKAEQDLAFTRSGTDGVLTFTCIPTIGPHLVSVSLFDFTVTEKRVDVKERLEVKIPQGLKSFPTGIASVGTTSAVFVTDTVDGKVYGHRSEKSQELCINLDTNKSSQIAMDNQGRILLLFPQTKMIHVVDQQGVELDKWSCHNRNSRPVALTCTKEGRVVVADSKRPSVFIYKSDGEILGNEEIPKESVVDGVNNLCVDRHNTIVLAHHSQPKIHMYNSSGKPTGSFNSGATSFQLAVTSTSDGFVLVAQLGSIRILQLADSSASLFFVGEIPIVDGHIYTSLASANDGCVFGLDVGQKRLMKYGCQPNNYVL